MLDTISKIIGSTLGSIALVGMIFTASLWFGGIMSLPKQVAELTAKVDSINRANPELIEFLGTGVASPNIYEPGDTLIVLFGLRRVASCETDIIVRFFSWDLNRIVTKYNIKIPTQKAPVTKEFILFPVEVLLPDDMERGIYSYTPRIKPKECGVYNEQVIISTPFRVVEKGTKDDYQ